MKASNSAAQVSTNLKVVRFRATHGVQHLRWFASPGIRQLAIGAGFLGFPKGFLVTLGQVGGPISCRIRWICPSWVVNHRSIPDCLEICSGVIPISKALYK